MPLNPLSRILNFLSEEWGHYVVLSLFKRNKCIWFEEKICPNYCIVTYFLMSRVLNIQTTILIFYYLGIQNLLLNVVTKSWSTSISLIQNLFDKDHTTKILYYEKFKQLYPVYLYDNYLLQVKTLNNASVIFMRNIQNNANMDSKLLTDPKVIP